MVADGFDKRILAHLVAPLDTDLFGLCEQLLARSFFQFFAFPAPAAGPRAIRDPGCLFLAGAVAAQGFVLRVVFNLVSVVFCHDLKRFLTALNSVASISLVKTRFSSKPFLR